MRTIWLFLALLGATALLNLAEMALVAVRASALAASDDRRAGSALQLKRRPGLFLAALQASGLITDLLTGAFVVTALEEALRGALAAVPLLGRAADVLGSIGAFAAVSFLVLVFGDLTPKSIALAAPERWALATARPIGTFIAVAQPFFSALEAANALVLRLLGLQPENELGVSQAEIRRTLAEGLATGALLGTERSMLERVLDLEHRSVRSVMTGRRAVQAFAEDADAVALRGAALGSTASRLLVMSAGLGEPVGVVRRPDLLAALAQGEAELRTLMRPIPYVVENASVLGVLAALRDGDAGIAVVVDEHGAMLGVVTFADVLEAIAGDIPTASPGDTGRPSLRAGANGSFVLPGTQPVDDLVEELGISISPERSYKTVAGMVIDRARHLPSPGESFVFSGFTVEVLDIAAGTVTRVRLSLESLDNKETAP